MCGAESATCLEPTPARGKRRPAWLCGLLFAIVLASPSTFGASNKRSAEPLSTPTISTTRNRGPSTRTCGTFHTSEGAVRLRHALAVNHPFTDEDQSISDQMSSLWANFAKTGKPNGMGLADWPEFQRR